MSSRRSEDSPSAAATEAAAAPAGPAATAFRNPFTASLAANLPIPILLLLLIPIGSAIDGRGFDPSIRHILMLVGINIILSVSLQLINGFSGQFALGHAGFMAIGAYLAAYPAMTYSQKLTDPAATLWFFISLSVATAIAGAVLFGVFVLIRKTRRIHRVVPMILLLLVLIWLIVDFSLAFDSSKLSFSVRLPPGYYVWTRGWLALQQFFSWLVEAGITPAARVSGALPIWLAGPICFLVLIVGGGACASVVGLIVGLPALRLRGDYLAIATLGMSEIIRIVIQNSRPLGGALGLTPIPKYTNFAWLYGAVVITTVVIWRLAYSAKGRAIMAVREDEIAAAAVGIDTTRQKVVAFMVGAFFGGVAGGMYALYSYSITPGSFRMDRSIEIVVMVTLGGLGSISGAILAAIILTVLPELLRYMGAEISDYRMIIYSALLVVMMLVRPQGLLGGRELWPRRFFGKRGQPRGFPIGGVK